MFETSKTLIVVYKDEMAMNQFKKIVENKKLDCDTQIDDIPESINIVSWDQKTWLANKTAGNIKDKVLFLGDIKGADELLPVIDVLYSENGIKFGNAGSQAILYADLNYMSDEAKYNEFLDELLKMDVPDVLKKSYKASKIEKETAENENNSDTDDSIKSKVLKVAKDTLVGAKKIANESRNMALDIMPDLFDDKKSIERQMMFYGISKICDKDLEVFMNR